MHKKIWFQAGLTALLVACGTPTNPRPITDLHLVYQLDVRLSDAGTAQAALKPVGGSGLQAQQLESVTDPIQLTYPSVTTMTFITRKNDVDYRHVSTTFQVTNKSATALNRLMLLPVVLTDTDGDPTNNATAPTIAGTPYRSVQLFDGTNVPAQASGFILTQSQTVDINTGLSTPNPAATPFLNGLNLSHVTESAPAGLTMTIQNQGWLAADTLAPGATTPVTFAVDIPINRSAPKTQVYGFSLMFTTAQDITGTDVGLPAHPATVQGTLPSWPYAGLNAKVAEEYSNIQGELSRKQILPISDQGGVNMPLIGPGPGDLQPLLDLTCTFTGQKDVTNLNYATASLRVYSPDDDLLGTVTERDASNERVSHLYAQTAASIHGTVNCPEDFDLAYEYDLNVQPGWNLVNIKATQPDPNGPIILSYKSLPSNTRTRLRFDSARKWLSLKTSTWGSQITLQAGQSVTLPVEFLQGGGISGPITLETNVPGIHITPNTLNIPALSAQMLGAQSYKTNLTFTADPGTPAQFSALRMNMWQNGTLVGFWTFDLTVTP